MSGSVKHHTLLREVPEEGRLVWQEECGTSLACTDYTPVLDVPSPVSTCRVRVRLVTHGSERTQSSNSTCKGCNLLGMLEVLHSWRLLLLHTSDTQLLAQETCGRVNAADTVGVNVETWRRCVGCEGHWTWLGQLIRCGSVVL